MSRQFSQVPITAALEAERTSRASCARRKRVRTMGSSCAQTILDHRRISNWRRQQLPDMGTTDSFACQKHV
eukprot:4120755-Prymnesium_polylepis.3